jgi:gamma-glutamylaminecyclotransferase
MTGKAILFVYGTLKRGGRNVQLMACGRFLRDAVTAPRYRVYDLGPHPALVVDDASGLAVRGELWEVDAPTLAALDQFEEVPGPFVRAAVEVAGTTGVEAYFWNRPVPPGTPSGDRWPLVRL